jgi:hypothetical protein
MIQLGLVLAIAAAALVASPLVAGILASLTALTFWTAFGMTFAALTVAGCLWLARRQRRAVRKTIRDFPNKGDVRHHDAEWKGEHFPRLLSRFVPFARSANAIDETRADFDRLPWGPGRNLTIEDEIDGHKRFEQMWFAGNHSDVGGSYPEAESRLSDIALQWMVEEATRIPNGLKVDGQQASGDASGIARLRLFPASDGLQHCEVAGMRDTLDALPGPLRKLMRGRGWAVKVRTIDPGAPVHATVVERFRLPFVPQCAGSGPYRPAALSEHGQFKQYY